MRMLPLLAALSVLAFARVASAEETVNERTVEHRPNLTLFSEGAGIFTLAYGGSVVAAAVSSRESDKRLFVPLVGPWMALAERSCSGVEFCGNNEDLAKAMLVTGGLVQAAGLVIAIASFVVPSTTSIEERTHRAKSKPLLVLPVAYTAGAGVGALGTF